MCLVGNAEEIWVGGSDVTRPSIKGAKKAPTKDRNCLFSKGSHFCLICGGF